MVLGNHGQKGIFNAAGCVAKGVGKTGKQCSRCQCANVNSAQAHHHRVIIEQPDDIFCKQNTDNGKQDTDKKSVNQNQS